MCLVALSSLAVWISGSGEHSFIELRMNYFFLVILSELLIKPDLSTCQNTGERMFTDYCF